MDAVLLDEITVENRKRKVNSVEVERLAESIQSVGLINPITICPDKRLLAGHHRLQAYYLLRDREPTDERWKRIPTHTIDPRGSVDGQLSDKLAALRAEEIEIVENLRRHELTDLERADLTDRLKVIYEALNPETRHGAKATKTNLKTGNVKKPRVFPKEPDSVSLGNGHSPPSFVDAIVTETGRSKTSVKQDAQIGANLTPEAKEIVRDTPIASKKTKLLELARTPAGKQAEKARAMVEPPTKRPAEPAEGVRDANGCLLHPDVGAAYLEAARIWTDGMSAIRALERAIKEACESDHRVGYSIAKKGGTDWGPFRDIRAEWKTSRPKYACPYCCAHFHGERKAHRDCKVCYGAGLVSKMTYESAPADYKEMVETK